MKYLQITPATPDKMGECVLPTMEKPDKNNFKVNTESNWAAWTTAVDQWRKHLDSLPKLPTTCTLPAGEWFEGKEDWKFEPTTEKAYQSAGNQNRDNPIIGTKKLVIVPVEQKDEPKKEELHPLDVYDVQILQSRLMKAESKFGNLKSEVRELMGRTWEAAIKWEGAENWMNIPHHGHPDKETFINSQFV